MPVKTPASVKRLKALSKREVRDLYDSLNSGITQERSDFFLSQIHGMIEGGKILNLNPEYQRRQVWDLKKKSLLIESLLLNVPIPNVFLFEKDLHQYEVMDGQQRLNSIHGFYNNDYPLKGLVVWKVLNGAFFKDLPDLIARSLDRRRLNATIVSFGARTDLGYKVDQETFERLNTGGVGLQAQELRNCFYPGEFNKMLIRASGNHLFTDLWDIPSYKLHWKNRSRMPDAVLSGNKNFKRMRDCEIVLRFFAVIDEARIKGSFKSMLDRRMCDGMKMTATEAKDLEATFESTLKLSHSIFGKETFRLPVGEKKGELSKPLYDAVMVACHRLQERAGALKKAKAKIKSMLKTSLRNKSNYETIVGKPNTAKAVKDRIRIVTNLMKRALR